MEYAIGRPGRIITVVLSEGEELYESIESLAAKEDIHSAAIFITGGFREAGVVVGPKTENPIVADMRKFTGPGEALGVGTIYCDDRGVPKMHLHAGIGRGDKVMAGCPRGGVKIFLTLEITIIEISGITAARKPDPQSGFKLLTFS
ncbi:MAG: DUF296 domain-containing protein [Anaerohalosphaeraceae bacterium]|nr:DUF296 domain-containing protein [Anaerohalosphaeraceae bacterium]